MIEFKPMHSIVKTGSNTLLSDVKKNLPAIAESNICAQLMEKKISLKCDIHPENASVILVSMEGGNLSYSIESYCCEEFKPKLELFLSPSK